MDVELAWFIKKYKNCLPQIEIRLARTMCRTESIKQIFPCFITFEFILTQKQTLFYDRSVY